MKQAPVLQLCGNDVQRDLSARNNPGEMTSVNLEIIMSLAAYGSTHSRELTEKTDKNLSSHGFTQADAHNIGDMIRKSELTINAHLSNLLGWRKGQDPKNPPLFQPGYSLVNTFVSKEQKGIAKDANAYLVRRNQVEQHFFPEYADMPKFEGKDRPNYAAFNMTNAEVGAASSYGKVVFVMKEHVKQQATYTLSDTFFALKYDFSNPEEGEDNFIASAQKLLSKLVKPEALAQLAEKTYPGAYGNEWKTQTNLNVSAGHGADADAQRSVEGLLMKAADSLDYTRVARLDGKRFHFLEKTMKVGNVHVMKDEDLRKSLMHEAELLTKATSPLADKRSEITRLKASDDEDERLSGEALEAEVTNAEIELAKLTDEHVVERIEAEIRNNPTKYPLFTKYYLNAD